MGLAISRSIIEAHGGQIFCQSVEGEGATFRFWLPLEVTAIGEEIPVLEGRAPVRIFGTAHHVCLVDDDPAVREAVCRLLSLAGASVQAFDSAAAALQAGALGQAQCVLLDVQMPGTSGVELHAEMLRRGFTASVVFLSARNDAQTGVAAIKRGAAEYLAKPVDSATLLEVVRKALAEHAQRQERALAQSRAKERLARLSRRERDVLRGVVAGRLNKQIAAELAIAEATVKQHRARVMDKMQAGSVAELLRVCQDLDLPPVG